MVTKIDLNNPCIIVPLDNNNAEKLFRCEFDNLECEYFSLTRKTLYEIFATGFFDHLNSKYNLMISDYEQEDIMDKEMLNNILNDDIKMFKGIKNLSFWNNLEKCIINAIKKQTGIFFFF